MRYALLLARLRGESQLKVISGPEVPYPQQVDRWKGLMMTPHDFDLLEMLESDSGVTRRKRFREQTPQLDRVIAESDLLTESVMAMSDEELAAYAPVYDVDLTGLTERIDIVTAIVMTIRLGRAWSVQANPDLAEDPGTFHGPALPSGLSLPSAV